MFGHNTIVGQSYFKDAGDKLMVTSRFVTLQGEGPYRGEPAFFLRLAKCQLACSFCDTFFDDGDWMTVSEIDQSIDQILGKHFNGNIPIWARDLWGGVAIENSDDDPLGALKKKDMVFVLTGGEPMLQKNIVPLLERMNQRFRNTQIESNGLLVQPIPAQTTLVVSPKCLEKDGVAVKYLEPNKAMLERADCLKFVMCADQDSPYSSVPEWAHTWRNRTGKPVFVSPMNIYNEEPQKSKQLRAEKNQISIEERSTVDEKISFWDEGLLDMKANQRNHEYAGAYCLNHGFTLNLQIHLLVSMA